MMPKFSSLGCRTCHLVQQLPRASAKPKFAFSGNVETGQAHKLPPLSCYGVEVAKTVGALMEICCHHLVLACKPALPNS